MRENCSWVPSPNCFTPKTKRKITALIIHSTATSGIDSPREWLSSPESKVSAHYLIGRTGTIIQMVEDKDVAYHAGKSEWRGVKGVNAFSIGIELVNSNDGIMDYPEDQIAALVSISVPICKENGIKLADVVGHKDIAPGRKNDPAGFQWDDFKSRLTLAGIV
jgi:N-acetylmuramoyl-L-alanine amidase